MISFLFRKVEAVVMTHSWPGKKGDAFAMCAGQGDSGTRWAAGLGDDAAVYAPGPGTTQARLAGLVLLRIAQDFTCLVRWLLHTHRV